MEQGQIVVMLTEELYYSGTDSKHQRYFFTKKGYNAKKFGSKAEAQKTVDEIGAGYVANYIRGGLDG